MKSLMKALLRSCVSTAIGILGSNTAGRLLLERICTGIMSRAQNVTHRGVEMRFCIPNAISQWRVETFSSKEPETLNWIESIPRGAVLWDVGANVGLYSVYAAKARDCRVYSFEPSVFNLELLARNISLNLLSERICIVPLALSELTGASMLRMTTTEWGGALSTFGEDFGWDGRKIRQLFQFRTLGIRLDDVYTQLAIPRPDYIKMDVDGLEHSILRGGINTLKQIQGIIIEVNDDFSQQAEGVREILTLSGLYLKEKSHSELIANSTSGLQNSFNQIWVRR